MIPRQWFSRLLALFAVLLCRPETAHACAVCFGKSDSALAKGMNMGIFTLLGFIISVLAAISCFFVFIAVRSSRQPHRDGFQPSHNSSDNPAHS